MAGKKKACDDKIENAEDANMWLVEYLHGTLEDSSSEVRALRGRLARSYRVILVLSIVMFLVGLALVAIPAFKLAFSEADAKDAITALAGIGDLVLLFLARPVKHIQNLMGDMTQLTLAINSYRCQVSLRLLQMRIVEPETVGDAAVKIHEAAKSSIGLIASHFESHDKKQKIKPDA